MAPSDSLTKVRYRAARAAKNCIIKAEKWEEKLKGNRDAAEPASMVIWKMMMIMMLILMMVKPPKSNQNQMS